MTMQQQEARRTTGPAHPDRGDENRPRLPEQRRVVLHGRPRSVEGEEAYLRSVMEQAATDIAAGW